MYLINAVHPPQDLDFAKKDLSKENIDQIKVSPHVEPPGRTVFRVDFCPHQSPGWVYGVLHPLLFCPVIVFFVPNT